MIKKQHLHNGAYRAYCQMSKLKELQVFIAWKIARFYSDFDGKFLSRNFVKVRKCVLHI